MEAIKKSLKSLSVLDPIRDHFQAAGMQRRLQEIANNPVDVESYSLSPFVEKKCIFIHIPKSAGLSVALDMFGCRAGGHATYRDYRAYFGLLIKDYFVFSFVRNPLDRAYSAYSFLTAGGISQYDAELRHKVIRHHQSFEAFVLDYLNPKTAREMLHFRPQLDYLSNQSGEVDLNFVGRFEAIHNDYQQLCQLVGSGSGRLNLINKTPYKPQRKFGQEVVDKLVSIYEKDFAAFNYSPS